MDGVNRGSGGTGAHGAAARRMRAAERRDLIVRTVASDGTVSVEDLASSLGVTPSTIRRDLALLTEQGAIARTYGGAITAQHVPEPSLGQRAALAVAEKERIAAWAADRIASGDTVILDAGTTTGRVARRLRTRTGLTVITSGLTVLLELRDAAGVEVVLLGGTLRRVSQGFAGPLAELALTRLSAGKVFLGADGLDARRGICEASLAQTALKELMAERAREVYVLADSSKLGQAPFTAWAPGPLRRPWTLVTDTGAAPERLAPFRELPACTVVTV
ncbi:DeoR/GlpR family DNA-binding transcription regulator [Streptomyces sp. 7-21]|jgi:DeoR/GlpR family transcriptional regulator of sugar metabolism|uniref:DeoR/GlpR family DNA-binding transcription regulator n=1 Tax=Streptomyces sp. 7-21 TaxID=2802283 RepID=UPI00191EDAB1|nr:DeoR/GlpR family DNA-binding transcription regulator [Streptomyces sp. 7-21]MBL1066652.1 DeoR/GlpR transcriptional regulator [Streptomyces sp. 7-21]